MNGQRNFAPQFRPGLQIYMPPIQHGLPPYQPTSQIITTYPQSHMFHQGYSSDAAVLGQLGSNVYSPFPFHVRESGTMQSFPTAQHDPQLTQNLYQPYRRAGIEVGSLMEKDLSLRDTLNFDFRPPPPKPNDERVVQMIEDLCQYIARYGPEYEGMTRREQLGNPAYKFLFSGVPGSEAAAAHEYFLWMKEKCTLSNGLHEVKKHGDFVSGSAQLYNLHEGNQLNGSSSRPGQFDSLRSACVSHLNTGGENRFITLQGHALIHSSSSSHGGTHPQTVPSLRGSPLTRVQSSSGKQHSDGLPCSQDVASLQQALRYLYGDTLTDSVSVNVDEPADKSYLLSSQQSNSVDSEQSVQLNMYTDENTRAAEDVKINQVKADRRKKNSKSSTSKKDFKVAIARFVKEILRPFWREGRMSKVVFKMIVKKCVDKVSGSVKRQHIPKTQMKIDGYIFSSQSKLTKLVMATTKYEWIKYNCPNKVICRDTLESMSEYRYGDRFWCVMESVVKSPDEYEAHIATDYIDCRKDWKCITPFMIFYEHTIMIWYKIFADMEVILELHLISCLPSIRSRVRAKVTFEEIYKVLQALTG